MIVILVYALMQLQISSIFSETSPISAQFEGGKVTRKSPHASMLLTRKTLF